jgi:hypothetical protein
VLQVLNDLLDPSRTNLRLREDPRRGVHVEGIREETLVSAEHALQVIAMGNENRKASGSMWVGRSCGWVGGRRVCVEARAVRLCCGRARA